MFLVLLFIAVVGCGIAIELGRRSSEAPAVWSAASAPLPATPPEINTAYRQASSVDWSLLDDLLLTRLLKDSAP
ncbi:hypothetical protein ACWKSP_33580 [Micromonosporaceae bacterium Da 78-11]